MFRQDMIGKEIVEKTPKGCLMRGRTGKVRFARDTADHQGLHPELGGWIIMLVTCRI